jgi:hypothetical protein
MNEDHGDYGTSFVKNWNDLHALSVLPDLIFRCRQYILSYWIYTRFQLPSLSACDGGEIEALYVASRGKFVSVGRL